ncbi:MAG: PHB accumulation regulatory domain-containing protein, partial [Alphaproteobacteria bacterium]
RAVLGQIIFEHESKGQHLLPITVLRQLIQYYGDSMQALVPSYLESSLAAFARDQDQLREQMSGAFKGSPVEAMEDQARRNMDMFSEAVKMWMPFGTGNAEPETGADENRATGSGKPSKPAASGGKSEIDTMREQLRAMQEKIDTIADKG